MSRKVLAVAGVVFLLATAGCGGFLGGEDGTRSPYTVSATATDTATPTETATWTPQPSTPSPTERPVVLPPALNETLPRQPALFREVESFSLRRNYTVFVSGEVGTFERVTYRVNRSTETGLLHQERLRPQRSNASESTVYRSGDRIVERIVNPEGRPVYRNESSANEPVNTSTTVFTVETRKLREIHLERNGTTTFAGEEMVRYTAQGVEDAPSGMGAIAAYRTAVLVDDDGLVRVVETRFVERNDDGDPIVYQVRMELTNLGDTAVKRPGWITNTTSTENLHPRKDYVSIRLLQLP